MNIYESTNVARALLYWAKQENVGEVRYLEDRMYAVADGDMVILLTADSYDEAKRKSKARHTQGEWIIVKDEKYGDNVKCPFCGKELAGTDLNFCCKCGADMRGGAE